MTLTPLENGEPVSKMSVSYIFLLGHPLLETLGWGGQHTHLRESKRTAGAEVQPAATFSL